MSINTWRKEFYPIRAIDSDKKFAATHSLQKWKGFRPGAMKRHHVRRSREEDGYFEQGSIFDKAGGEFEFYGSTCSLCCHFIDENSGQEPCRKCPITKLRGQACDNALEGEKFSPWGAWYEDRDPEPMIAILETLAARESARAAKTRAATTKAKSTTATHSRTRTQPKRSESV